MVFVNNVGGFGFRANAALQKASLKAIAGNGDDYW